MGPCLLINMLLFPRRYWPSAGQSHETNDLYEFHGDVMKTRTWSLGETGEHPHHFATTLKKQNFYL